jgi:thioredoxin 1
LPELTSPRSPATGTFAADRPSAAAPAYARAARIGENGGMNNDSTITEPSRAEVDEMTGPAVLEFGTAWCGYCRSAQPVIGAALADHPGVRHIKVEDGPGRPLGRSFGVRLWPTLIFLKDGEEAARVTRPQNAEGLREALRKIDPAG